MVNNFDAIKSLLKFESEDEFYHLQIIKRRKEHPELPSNSKIIKTYYVSSIEYLEQKEEEIKHLCDFHIARACINLNRRSFEKVAFHVLKKVTDQILNKDFKSVRKAYESVCGAQASEKEKKWIIDIDETFEDSAVVTLILDDLYHLEPKGEKYLTLLQTKNGYHIITKPFNTKQFSEIYKYDVQKDNPTMLYMP